MSGMVEFAQKHKIRNGHFTGIGAVNRAVLGWTDTERSNAQKMIPINEEAELIAFSGSISTNAQGVSTVHGHGAVSLKNGSVVGGHVFELHISIIGEVFVTEGEGSADAAR
jgi:predicted DNA-binding protein with PD1-like motif